MTCTAAYDIAPEHPSIIQKNALKLTEDDLNGADFIITNPPWKIKLLHPMIEHFTSLRPTWLLFYADWYHTLQASKYIPMCELIVPVGRVKWIEGSKSAGKDNVCWYLFDKHHKAGPLLVPRE